MDPLEEKFQSLIVDIQERERIARKRTIIYSSLPIFMALLMFLFTGWLIRNAQRELDEINKNLQSSQQKLANANNQLNQAEYQIQQLQQERSILNNELDSSKKALATATFQLEQTHNQVVALQTQVAEQNKILNQITKDLSEAASLRNYIYTGNILLSSKELIIESQRQFELLKEILLLKEKNVKFQLGGYSPEEGFDSPSFVAYMLVKHGLIRISSPTQRYNLRNLLPVIGMPSIGDIVFYELGYTMFYYEGDENIPFVIGMTPLGILALRTDFAHITNYGDVKY